MLLLNHEWAPQRVISMRVIPYTKTWERLIEGCRGDSAVKCLLRKHENDLRSSAPMYLPGGSGEHLNRSTREMWCGSLEQGGYQSKLILGDLGSNESREP